MKVSDTSTYLEAAALEGEITLEILGARVPVKTDIGTDGRPMSEKSVILSYKGAKKEHVACRTVQKQIRAIHGNDISGWKGKKIILFPTTCNAFGNPKTPCIRVKNIDPATGKAPEAW
jgi:hypothetical protein